MITLDLITYIQAQKRKNISENVIRSRLGNAGWHPEDIDEAFVKLSPPQGPVPASLEPLPRDKSLPFVNHILARQEGIDPYREPFTTVAPKAMENRPVEPVTYVIPSPSPKKDVEPTPPPSRVVFAQSYSEANKSNATLSSSVNIEPAPVQINIPKPIIPPLPIKETHLEIRNEELMPKLIPKTPPKQATEPSPVVKKPLIDIIRPKPIVIPPPVLVVPTPPPQSTPTAEPAPIPTSQISYKLPSNFSSLQMSKMTPSVPQQAPAKKIVDSLPKGAILHSYQQILSSAREANKGSFKAKNKKLYRWLIAILVVSILGGIAFAVAADYIKLPSIVKKDPKMLLLNTKTMLLNLKSYKTETTMTLSMPSFADITNGLIIGEAISSHDKDSVSLSLKSLIQNNARGPILDYKAVTTSSLFEDKIASRLVYADGAWYVTTPELGSLLGDSAPPSSTVLVPNGGFNIFTTFFPYAVEDILKKIDLDKAISVLIPSSSTDETLPIFTNLISNARAIEKAPESLRGVPSYHYEISLDKSEVKKGLDALATAFAKDLSSAEQARVGEDLGAVAVDSFEVWVGQDDDTIHQYKLTISIPLSKILDLDDKGIADQTVNLALTTSYFDFDVSNDIAIPTGAISIDDFLKSVRDMKLKNDFNSFAQAARTLHNALGVYGASSNPAGSCVNPNKGSLFSPLGHTKGANPAVGTIAGIMTELIPFTNGALSCYSTPGAWAVSAPLATDPKAYYCVDSTGSHATTQTEIKGPLCK